MDDISKDFAGRDEEQHQKWLKSITFKPGEENEEGGQEL